MNLVELIKALKEELKHGAGDRELRPDVTVAAILAVSAPPGGTSGEGRPWSPGLAPAIDRNPLGPYGLTQDLMVLPGDAPAVGVVEPPAASDGAPTPRRRGK